MKTPSLLSVPAALSALCLAVASWAPAQDPGPASQPTLEQLKQEFQLQEVKARFPIEDLQQKYEAQLAILMTKVSRAGNLEYALHVQKELEGFRARSHQEPKDVYPEFQKLQALYLRSHSERAGAATKQLRVLANAYDAKLNQLMVHLTKAGEIEAAQEVHAELADLESYRQGLENDAKLAEVLSGTVPSGRLPSEFDDNLVLYYSFDEKDGSKVKDQSGNERDGANSGAEWSSEGHLDGAYSFDGVNDRITLVKPLPNMRRMTISAWVQYTAQAGSGGIFSDYDGRSGNDVMFAIQSPKVVHIRADKSGGRLNELIQLDQPIGEGWHHVVWTMRSTQSNLYIDGKHVAVVRKEGTNEEFHGACYVGFSNDRNSWAYFQGMIDEFRIWERELTASEIELLYLATAGTNS